MYYFHSGGYKSDCRCTETATKETKSVHQDNKIKYGIDLYNVTEGCKIFTERESDFIVR